MALPQQPDADPRNSAQESSAPTEEIRADHLLLERLKNEPPIKEQLHPTVLIAIIIIVVALGTVVYFISRQPEKFADDPHAKNPQHQQEQPQSDSSEIVAKRMHFAPMLDSLQNVVKEHQEDLDAQLEFANVLYETEFWADAKEHYEIYLKTHPNATDPRVDYAFTIVQTTQDFKKGLAEIEKALAIDPDHVKGLFNAGLFAIQAFEDRKQGIAKSEEYFHRSRDAAQKKGEVGMVGNIDRILEEIEKIKSQGSR